jgi:hypothetical protein
MEVHHHSHDPESHESQSTHIKKKWRAYFWEFLMLFLAVFCGFLAEYQLEHQIDRENEERYMSSMVQDLEEDVKNIDVDIMVRNERIQTADTLTKLILAADYQKNTGRIYYLARKYSVLGYFFFMTDGTMMELKNSGGFKLIRKRAIVDSLQSYYNFYQQSEDAQDFAVKALDEYRTQMVKVFNVRIFDTMIKDFPAISIPEGNPALFNSDPALINEYLMRVQLVKTMAVMNIKYLKELKIRAGRLQKQIIDGYPLEDE